MNTLVAVSIDTPAQAIIVGLTLIMIGALVQYWISLELDDRRDARTQDFDAHTDVALDNVADVEPTLVIPVQRITNGEDLLGGGPR